MGWIATKAQTIKRGGNYVQVKPGDPVPEAEHWPNRPAWVRMGFIKYIARDVAPEPVESVETKVTVTEEPKEKPKPKRKRTYIKRKKKEE